MKLIAKIVFGFFLSIMFIMPAQADVYDRFEPAPSNEVTVNYEVWDKILNGIVIESGPSTRFRESKPKGMNFGKGHRSAYRLEGNRIVFSQFTDTWKRAIDQNAQDLMTIATDNDIVALSKNEQLAFWINLHNATLINLLSQNYPVMWPDELVLEGSESSLHDAKVITVRDVPLSLRDIRENIVYRYWDSPVSIYGFFLGDIGSPSIQKEAYTGENVDRLLELGATEFINSLRGVHRWDDAVRISELYRDVNAFYFEDFDDDIRQHVLTYASSRVKDEIGNATTFSFGPYQSVIADVAGGNSSKAHKSVEVYTNELTRKFKSLKRQGQTKQGKVVIEDIETNNEP